MGTLYQYTLKTMSVSGSDGLMLLGAFQNGEPIDYTFFEPVFDIFDFVSSIDPLAKRSGDVIETTSQSAVKRVLIMAYLSRKIKDETEALNILSLLSTMSDSDVDRWYDEFLTRTPQRAAEDFLSHYRVAT